MLLISGWLDYSPAEDEAALVTKTAAPSSRWA